MRKCYVVDDASDAVLVAFTDDMLAECVGAEQLLDLVELFPGKVDSELLADLVEIAEAHILRGAQLLPGGTISVDLEYVPVDILPLVSQLVGDHSLVTARRLVVCAVGNCHGLGRGVTDARDLATRSQVLFEVQALVEAHEPSELAVVYATPSCLCGATCFLRPISKSRFS